MARSKASNTQRDQWAVWKAVEVVSELIDCVELDTDGPRSVRLEALASASWDDIVVEVPAGLRLLVARWQIKRQNTPLDELAFGKLLGDMSTLLKAPGPHGRFHFGTPHEIQISLASGANLAMRCLRDLCAAARATGVDAATLVDQGTVAEKCWCQVVSTHTGKKTAAEVAELLAFLEIEELGLEGALRTRAVERLRNTYRNAEELADQLFQFLVSHTDPRIEVTYDVVKKVVLDVHGKRESTRTPWLRASREKAWAPWAITGPLGASDIVRSSWPKKSAAAVIRVAANPQKSGDDVEVALLRLIAHRAQNVKAEVSSLANWERYVQMRSGGTFGVEIHSDDLGLQEVPENSPSVSVATVLPQLLGEQLQTAMQGEVWQQLKAEVDLILQDPQRASLEIEASLLGTLACVWRKWEAALEPNEELRAHFLGMCMATREEWLRSEFSRAVRVGARAVPGVARGIVFALALATVVDPSGVKLEPSLREGANLVLGSHAAHLIALSYASRPGSHFGQKIADAASHFLDDELGCTILSESEAPPEILLMALDGQAVPYNVPVASLADYQSSYVPKPVLTGEVDFRRALASGAESLRKFLGDRLKRFSDAEWDFLRQAVEAPTGSEQK